MKRFFYLLVVAAILCGCGGDGDLKGLQIVPAKHNFSAPGEKKTLVVVTDPEGYQLTGVTWSSDDEEVATVNKDGLVEAVGFGSAVITVKAEGKEATCTIKVQTYPEALEFHTILRTSYGATDVLDTYSYTENGISYEDTLATISIVFLGTYVDYSSTKGFIGSGAIAWLDVAALHTDIKSGPDMGKSSVYILGKYVPANALPTKIDDWITNHQDPKKFLKGKFDVDGINAAFDAWNEGDDPISFEDYLTGAELLFINSPLSDEEDMSYYGIISETGFDLGVSGDKLAFNSYDLRGQIMLWLYKYTDPDTKEVEWFYLDDSGQIEIPATENDPTLKLITLDEAWKQGTFSGAPLKITHKVDRTAKCVRVAPKTKTAATKLNTIDWSKVKVVKLK